VTLEAAWLYTFGVRPAFALAVVANGASFTLGLFAYVYLGW